MAEEMNAVGKAFELAFKRCRENDQRMDRLEARIMKLEIDAREPVKQPTPPEAN